jgi:hypothetical protein
MRRTNGARCHILRPIRHDLDFPGVLVGHGGDGQACRPFADDHGLEFFARFCWLLQSVHHWFEAVRNCRLRLSAPVDVSGADVSLWLSATAPSSSGGRRSIKSNESKRAAGTCKLDFDPKLRVTLAKSLMAGLTTGGSSRSTSAGGRHGYLQQVAKTLYRVDSFFHAPSPTHSGQFHWRSDVFEPAANFVARGCRVA